VRFIYRPLIRLSLCGSHVLGGSQNAIGFGSNAVDSRTTVSRALQFQVLIFAAQVTKDF